MRTNAGSTWQAQIMGALNAAASSALGTGSHAPANWIGLTANATAPAAGNTSLAGELTGTLARAQATTYSHTTGTNSYAFSRTFTCDAGNSGVTVNKVGIFTGASGATPTPTMVFETALSTAATLVTNDTLTITETVTI